MTIIPRDARVLDIARAPSPGQRNVTRPGATPRVGPAAATGHSHGGHSIGRMDQPQLDLPLLPAPPQPDETRPWIYDRILALVVSGHVWTDNQRRHWVYDGGESTGTRMPTRDQGVLATLQQLGHVRVTRTKVDMDVNDGRTLRVRCYEPTASGTELHTRWAGLSTYTA